MQVKCFYKDKPQSDVIFAIYSDFSGGQKFWRADKGWYGYHWNFDEMNHDDLKFYLTWGRG